MSVYFRKTTKCLDGFLTRIKNNNKDVCEDIGVYMTKRHLSLKYDIIGYRSREA